MTFNTLSALLCISLLALAVPRASASDSSGAQGLSAEVTHINSRADIELYLPLHTHHLRSAYDSQRIRSFNETPWGAGAGKGYIDSEHGWHGLYVMAFADSHNRIEPVAGYGRLYPVLQAKSVRLSLGYTAFLTARQDIAHYTPVPGVLPLASVQTGAVSLMATYMPGGHNNGNVVFIFGKLTLPN